MAILENLDIIIILFIKIFNLNHLKLLYKPYKLHRKDKFVLLIANQQILFDKF